jgi:hypothetical protein
MLDISTPYNASEFVKWSTDLEHLLTPSILDIIRGCIDGSFYPLNVLKKKG